MWERAREKKIVIFQKVLLSTPNVMSIFFSVSAIASVVRGLVAIWYRDIEFNTTMDIRYNKNLILSTEQQNQLPRNLLKVSYERKQGFIKDLSKKSTKAKKIKIEYMRQSIIAGQKCGKGINKKP